MRRAWRRAIYAVSALAVGLALAVSAGASTRRNASVLVKGWTGTISYTQHEEDGISRSVSIDTTFTIIGHSPRYTPEIGGGHALYWMRTSGAVKILYDSGPNTPCPRTVTTTWSGSYSPPRTAYTVAGVVVFGVVTIPRFLRIDSVETLPFVTTVTDCTGTKTMPAPEYALILPSAPIRAPHTTGRVTLDAWPGKTGLPDGDGTYTWHLKWCSAPATARRCTR